MVISGIPPNDVLGLCYACELQLWKSLLDARHSL
jgi:hypothetical protein